MGESERFEFGRNWQRFLAVLDEERIAEARNWLATRLEVETLEGKSFLDIGSGSGLSSLVARQLGARVHSFDYDRQSVACTAELRRRFFPDDPAWTVESGDVLDGEYIRSLGTFDVVYSWGVLHHTGDLQRALEHALVPVVEGGQLYIAIYNFQIYWTKFYTRLKKTYVAIPAPAKGLLAGGYIALQASKGLVKDLILLRNPLQRYRDKKKSRGMSMVHDWIDWVGGYPFETARRRRSSSSTAPGVSIWKD